MFDIGRIIRRLAGSDIEILPGDRVKLPAILGIKPGYYLAAVYGLVILFVFCMIFFYPGLSKPGASGLIFSEPEGAAVRVDDITLGTTPCEVFLPRGTRKIEIVLPGFQSAVSEIDVKGRIFASLFFPQKIHIDETLEARDPAAVFADEAADFVRWTFAGEPDEAHQIPLSLSEGAYRTGQAAKDPEIRAEMNAVLKAAARFAVTEAAARDLSRSLFLTGNSGLSPSPLTLIASLQEAAAYLSLAPERELDAWLSLDFNNTGHTAIAVREAAPSPLIVQGVEFIPVPGGGLSSNGLTRDIPSMLIARTETGETSWDAFIAENPAWSAENRETLASAGLVSGDYLLPLAGPAYPRPAVPGVSWHAAQAYCRWLNGKLSSAWQDWEVRLPSEYEWEYAAVYFDGRAGTGPENLSGGLWEWCENPYAPLDFFPAPEAAVRAVNSPERPVRGGSWINPPNSVSFVTRASLPPHSSSPFVGFRPVIAPKASRME